MRDRWPRGGRAGVPEAAWAEMQPPVVTVTSCPTGRVLPAAQEPAGPPAPSMFPVSGDHAVSLLPTAQPHVGPWPPPRARAPGFGPCTAHAPLPGWPSEAVPQAASRLQRDLRTHAGSARGTPPVPRSPAPEPTCRAGVSISHGDVRFSRAASLAVMRPQPGQPGPFSPQTPASRS